MPTVPPLAPPLPVLFTHYGDEWIRGSEAVLLDLLRSLDRDRVYPVVWCNGLQMAAACLALGVTTYRRPFPYYFHENSTPFRPAAYRGLVREGSALVRRYGIRVLHASSAAPNQWLLPVARMNRIPLLAHLHSYYRLRSRYVCGLHQVTLLAGVSQHTIEPLLRDGMPAERTRVIYNGVDPKKFAIAGESSLRRDLGIPAGAVMIVAAGALVRSKGHDQLVEALGLLPRCAPEVHLVIAGEGPEREALARQASGLGLDRRVHLAGQCHDMAKVYRGADIFALASRAEAFGLVNAEAALCGLPAVSTRIGGIPEVIADGETGLLAPPDEPAPLAGALRALIENPELRRTLGQAGRRRAASLFTLARMAASFHDAYAHLAKVSRDRLGWLQGCPSWRPYFRIAR